MTATTQATSTETFEVRYLPRLLQDAAERMPKHWYMMVRSMVLPLRG